ncbi:DUF2163 domain-containing protein [Sphingobium sp. MI1205]|uniref:DUF2163 domain-containing protein n=1 Tax=Sphingobium sp. MI1205 TaxID=407020 RepID=UPI00076FE766|nr:DUF2163 domain-containing protein [Sphingobium sp. MI1205]AMK18694.1 hypothetical protein K663_11575 [Sphingobium sp. MI1205]
MSRTIPVGYIAHLASSTRSLCWCLRIDAANGVSVGLTTHDRPLSIDLGDGALDYVGGLTMSEVSLSVGLGADNFQASGPLGPLFTAADVLGGRWNRARFRLFQVNHRGLVSGQIRMLGGKLGQPLVDGHTFNLEGLGHTASYNQEIGRVTSPYCAETFGSARCKYPLLPDVWTPGAAVAARGAWDAGAGNFVRPSVFNGYHYSCSAAGTTGGSEPSWPTTLGATVSDGGATWTCVKAATIEAVVASVTSGFRFTIAALPFSTIDDELAYGRVAFTSGVLADDLEIEIFRWAASTRSIELYASMADLPSVGDALVIRRPCLNTRVDCRDSWRNTWNFRGEPDQRGSDQILRAATGGA